MLTILAYFLQDYNYSYLKLDGSTPVGARQGLINRFNNSEDIFVFLLTTKVGGLGKSFSGQKGPFVLSWSGWERRSSEFVPCILDV